MTFEELKHLDVDDKIYSYDMQTLKVYCVGEGCRIIVNQKAEFPRMKYVVEVFNGQTGEEVDFNENTCKKFFTSYEKAEQAFIDEVIDELSHGSHTTNELIKCLNEHNVRPEEYSHLNVSR